MWYDVNFNLLKEWDFSKNYLEINSVKPSSHKKVWWLCAKLHSWEASLKNRIINNSKCPFCANKKACYSNCLETLFPNIAKEWHPTFNDELKPNQVLSKSNTKVWWLCDKSHEWQARIANRTECNSGCPFCSNKKASSDNSLLSMFPNIASEWSKKNHLMLNEMLPKSGKKVWWICNENHEWQSKISDRTANNSGCPYCLNKKVSSTNSLSFLFPEISKEFHPFKNKSLTANDFIGGAHSKIWWKCSKNNNHEWFAEINSRTSNGRGCPFCFFNKNELITYNILNKLFNNSVISQYVLNIEIVDSFKNKIRNNIRIDFAVQHDNSFIFIEYNGRQHYEPVNFGKLSDEEAFKIHCNQKIRDEWLRNYCKDNDIVLIEIDGRKYYHNKIENYLVKQLESVIKK